MKPPTKRQREALSLIAEGRILPQLVREDDGWHARWRASVQGGDNAWIDICVREAAATPLTLDAEEQRHETLHDAWIAALRSRTGLVRWDDAECEKFARELDSWSEAAEEDGEKGEFIFRAEDGQFTVSCARPRGRRALKALGQATYVFGPLREMKLASGGEELVAALSKAEAEHFLSSGARELVSAGYRVGGCDIMAPVAAELDLAPESGETSGRVEAKLTVRVAGEVVGAGEVRFLLEQKSTLVFFRNRWIEVDRNILKEALRALEKHEKRVLSVGAALGFAAGLGSAGRLGIAEARAHGWLKGLVNELRQSNSLDFDDLSPIPGLSGTLRPYQRRAVAWMEFLSKHGFGALLADDMGLGKTIETIAWILREKSSMEESAPFLVVSPLTLVANWRHELARFAPGLKVMVHHGEGRALEQGFAMGAEKADVVLTSYSLFTRDYPIIRRVAWAGLVLDEAQAIKNPETRVARAARALGAPRRVALTGTPVENSPSDIWSLEEFLNPGFPGDRKEFSLLAQGAGAKRLRRALEPFLLRRLKTDPEIAGELGEKRTVKEYCALSPSQRREYEEALADWRAGEKRRGDVFALLTRLKLVCDGEGKEARLAELLESIFDAGESALVFTQYAKVGARLKTLLEKRFGGRVPFLHGSLSAREREEELALFNGGGPSAFILSLRAGGYGLNLVKATHVIHFDRWWNPAVEAQATDRAHRIGQARDVLVHAFMTEGTLEERIDSLLGRKALLAGELVSDGEKFLMSLKPEELEETVKLSGEDV